MIRINWIQCKTYDDAKNYTGVVYLHEWNGSPFYWGICDNSVFGGNTRKIDGRKRNPGYGSSYRHWIEGCLRHGGSLYIGVPQDLDGKTLQDIENTLIKMYTTDSKFLAIILLPRLAVSAAVNPSPKNPRKSAQSIVKNHVASRRARRC